MVDAAPRAVERRHLRRVGGEFEPGTYALAWEEQRVELNSEFFVAALDGNGEELWRRRRGFGEVCSADSGVLVSGDPTVKLRADESVAWSIDDAMTHLAPTDDGGFVGASSEGSNVIRLVRYGSRQQRRWTRTHLAEASLDWRWRDDGPDLREFDLAGVTVTPDGGFVVVGSGFVTRTEDRRVAYVLKTDAAGRVAWRGAYLIRGVDVHPEAIHALSVSDRRVRGLGLEQRVAWMARRSRRVHAAPVDAGADDHDSNDSPLDHGADDAGNDHRRRDGRDADGRQFGWVECGPARIRGRTGVAGVLGGVLLAYRRTRRE
jgi:hypothetical protein